MSHQAILRLVELKKAVNNWLREEHTEHQDKEGNLRAMFADEEHGNPQDCLQCRVEDLLR